MPCTVQAVLVTGIPGHPRALRKLMTLRLAVLGDSIAYGVGADHPSHTLAARLHVRLVAHGLPTEPRVFARSGARSSDLAAQVRSAVRWNPDLALVVIGANDLSHSVPPHRAARALRDAVRALRRTGAEVVVAPAPDLSVVPHVPAPLRAALRHSGGQLRAAQVGAVLDEGGRVADPGARTSELFGEDASLFSSDLFHPSSAGYAAIAEALAPVVVEAAVSAARSDAPVRTPPSC